MPDRLIVEPPCLGLKVAKLAAEVRSSKISRSMNERSRELTAVKRLFADKGFEFSFIQRLKLFRTVRTRAAAAVNRCFFNNNTLAFSRSIPLENRRRSAYFIRTSETSCTTPLPRSRANTWKRWCSGFRSSVLAGWLILRDYELAK